MLKKQIKVGGHYVAKVSNKLTTVRVDRIEERSNYKGNAETVYHVTNLATGRTTTFRSAQKFRSEARDPNRDAAVDQVLSDLIESQQRKQDAAMAQAKGRTSGELVTKSEVSLAPTPNEDERAETAQRLGGQYEVSETTDCPPLPDPDSQVIGGVETNTTIGPEGEKCADPIQSPTVTLTSNRPSDSGPSLPAPQPITTGSIRPSSPAVAAAKPVGLAAQLAAKYPATIDDAPHVIVQARAGTGKTTTLIEGLKALKGLPTTITPSPQQAAVWDALLLSKDSAKTVCFVAFNKSIAEELQRRVPAGCDAMTMHSLGYRAVTKQFGRCEVTSYRVPDLIAEELEVDGRELRRTNPVLLKATEDLVGLCKVNLVGHNLVERVPGKVRPGSYVDRQLKNYWEESLDQLCSHFDVEVNGQRDRVYALVPRILERCKDVRGKVDFNDMIWLPIALNLPVTRYDLLLTDESQDLNRCQQALAKKAGRRLVFVGDDRQAIYGFAGADNQSLSRLRSELEETDRGCVVLPLTVTRRCGKAIVEEAKRIVPDFEAHESNGEGTISTALFSTKSKNPSGNYWLGGESAARQTETRPVAETYRPLVRDGDFLLCRVNAPLVSECFRFLREGRKATIQGRDVGAGLTSLVKKLTKDDPTVRATDLVKRLEIWHDAEVEKEGAKKDPSEGKIIALGDKRDCLVCFCEDVRTAGDALKKIEEIFTDNKQSPGVRLSSIHRAKGLESDRVFFLMPERAECPHPMAKSGWQIEQEMNLLYVGVTRARKELVYVS